MTQTTTLRELDASIRDALYSAGLSDDAFFTPLSGSSQPCKVFVDRGAQFSGFDSEVRSDQVYITALLSEILTVPTRGSFFQIGAETWKVDRTVNADESRVVCLVTK